MNKVKNNIPSEFEFKISRLSKHSTSLIFMTVAWRKSRVLSYLHVNKWQDQELAKVGEHVADHDSEPLLMPWAKRARSFILG